ncbi:MAG: PDZ domain-containing protein, partial [Gemmatimonadetes bacterium]|nr:PDZ domain-containing protein [Gemmatimonadota bacterium]
EEALPRRVLLADGHEHHLVLPVLVALVAHADGGGLATALHLVGEDRREEIEDLHGRRSLAVRPDFRHRELRQPPLRRVGELPRRLVERDPADVVDLVIVVEEKRSLIEVQFREELYGGADQPVCIGKKDEEGRWLFPVKGALDPNDIAIAIGAPLGLSNTVTDGIISATGRAVATGSTQDDATVLDVIQTDAAINPGNSGGPLVNLRGEVIGINTAIASQTGTYSGYGFAVPVSIAKRVADDLIRHGAVHRPKLGVAIRSVSLADAEVFGLSAPNGAVVASLQAGPAADAGVRMGDVIVAVAGKPVDDTEDLMEQVALRQPGETIPVDIIRYGDRRRVNIRLGAFESAAASPAAATPASSEPLSRLGFSASASQNGVVVANVDPSSPAYEAGITPGFKVERINGNEVGSPNDLQGIANDLRPGSTVSVVGRGRDGGQTIVNYRLRR